MENKYKFMKDKIEEEEKELKEVKVTEGFLEEVSEDDNTIADKKGRTVTIYRAPKDTKRILLLITPYLLTGTFFIIFSICKSFGVFDLKEFKNLKIDIAEYGFKWFLSGINMKEYGLLVIIGIIFVAFSLYGYIYILTSLIKHKKKKSLI